MPEQKKTEELVLEARNFFESYKKEIGESIRKGTNVIFIDFDKLAPFSHELTDFLISNPEEILQILEVAIEESGLIINPRVRFNALPEDYSEKIRNLRAKHLNKFIQIEGIVRQASEVRPQVVNAKFECPACGTTISVLQIESKFREPSHCSCGRKGGFKLVRKDMVDAQRIVVEESPEALIGGEQPRRINIFLKEDLVEPKMEERTTPGSRVKVIGVLKEIPMINQAGGILTRYDIALEANNVIPMEETFEELDISEEDERQINEIAASPNVMKQFIDSIAPSIYGYEEIKKALVLQLFGGIKKKKGDGTQTRGDIHVFLVGDPGVAKSVNKDSKILYFCNNEYGYETIEKVYKKFQSRKDLNILSLDMKNHAPKWCKVEKIIRHAPEKELIKITTEHGKEIIATRDHSFITLSDNLDIIPIKGQELTNKNYLPIPINYHKPLIEYIKTSQFNSHNTNSKQIPEKIILDEDFGFFTGIFLSEGYIMKNKKSKSKSIIISNKNKEIIDKARKFIKKINLNFKERRNELWVSSVSLANLLSCCFSKEIESKVKGDYSRIKKIPDFAFFSPKEFISGLISGIFSGDGRFVSDKNRLKAIELVTVSKDLAETTSDILFSQNILNKIKRRKYIYKGEERKIFYVYVPYSNLQSFLNKFRFYGRKMLSMPKAIYSYNDLLPCGKILYDLTKKLGYNSRISGDRTFAAEMRTVKRRNSIGRIRLKKILEKFKDKSENFEFKILNKLANSNIIWSKITKIENCKKEEFVYDLCVPKTNTFTANGISVHNSQMLKFISTIAPKGRYVAGRGTSGAGLTASVVKDEFLRGWSLEAGAMVLANKGIICIDEIEKMDPQDRSAMHEAMEQQCFLPDFKMDLADGSKIEIGKFVDNLFQANKENIENNNNFESLALKDSVEILTTDFEAIYPLKIKKVSRHIAPDKFVKIILMNGREIILTPEHPCWAIKNGEITTIPAKNMKKGEFFPIVSEMPIKGAKQSFRKKPYKNRKIRWSKVKSIDVLDNNKIKFVYDIEVEPNHSFISNNMVLHNCVTISKANIQATLRSETSVLAAGNPKLGRFNPYDTVANQIDIPPALINRFDVIFILKDNPDRARDEAIAMHVLSEHQKQDSRPLIDRELLRKYIAYSKQRFQPKLTDEALEDIKKFYVDLRNMPISVDQPTKPLPISARQLEALIRLSEASAKARLSKKVTKIDTQVAIDLMKFYLMQVGYDYETKTFDIDRIATGVSTSHRGKIILVKETLSRLESRLGKLIPVEELMKELEGKITADEIDDSLQKLKQTGDIFEPRSGFIQKM